MKYIPADKLIAEIERRIEETKSMTPTFDQFFSGQISAFKGALKIVKSLQQEQPEVDLEKEYKTWWNSISGKINIEHMMEWYMHETARHFAEWGAIHLNARKEEQL